MLRINLLQEHRRQRPAFSWRAAGFGFLLGALVAAAAAMFFFRPAWRFNWFGGLGGQGPDAPNALAVTASPGAGQRRRADAVIRADSTGRLGGEAELRRPQLPGALAPAGISAAGADLPGAGQAAESTAMPSGDHATPPEIAPQRPAPGADCGQPGCPGGLHPGDVAEVPVSGAIHTVYVDSRTGAVIGEGDHPAEGVATVGVTEDLRLRVDTEFSDSVEIAIDIPERRWFVGGFAAADFAGLEAGLFVEHRVPLAEFPRLGCAVVAAAAAEVYRGSGGLGARVEVQAGVAF